jgi:hypothetical protein
MMRKMVYKGLVIVSLLAVLAPAVFAAGTPHTSWGTVTGSGVDTSTPWKFYVVARPTELLTGNIQQSGPNYFWQAPVGNLTTPWANGDDSVAVAWKETGTGTLSHIGYYAVMSENLSTTVNPQAYNSAALRQISVPTATVNAGAGRVDLTWTAATTDPAENGPGATAGANILRYNVYRSTNGTSFSLIGNSSTASYLDTSGTSGTPYYYAIELVYRGGVVASSGTPILSANSNQVTYPPPVVGDITPPAAITLAASTGTNAGEVNISWTAVGDDGTTGTATSYILKYSTSAITAANFDAATTYAQAWTPAAAGAAESKILTGLTPGATLYFSIKARDEVPNTGAFGNSVSAVVQTGALPSLTSATPNNGNQGQTLPTVAIVGSNTHFTAASTVGFGADITVGSVTFTNATYITANDVVISATAASGARTVTVMTGGETATGSIFTVNAGPVTSLVIDSFEGTEVAQAPIVGEEVGGYYVPFGPNRPTRAISTTIFDTGGTRAMGATYSWTGGDPAVNWGGGWGASLITNKDLGSGTLNAISYRIYGGAGLDTTTYFIQVTTVDDKAYRSPAQTLPASAPWTTVQIPYTAFWNDADDSGAQNGAEDYFSARADKTIKGYGLVYNGRNTTPITTAHYIDNIQAVTATISTDPQIISITPASGPVGIEITITGANFNAADVVRFKTDSSTTSVNKMAAGVLWTATSVTMNIPAMSVGNKTVKVGFASDVERESNGVTFEVTGATATDSQTNAYPNPFNPLGGEVTRIVFSPGTATRADIMIFDMTAKLVSKLNWPTTGTIRPDGRVEVVWDGKNSYGEIVGDGVYLYRVVDGGVRKGKILVVNKK